MRIEKQMLFQASVFLFRYLVVKVGFHIHFEGKFFLRFPHKKFCWRREYPRIKWDSSCSFRIISVLLSYVNSAGAGLAPQAGAGPSFLDEKKGSKDSPRGEFRFSPPLEPPLNDQRRCLWKPREAPALVLFSRTGTACA